MSDQDTSMAGTDPAAADEHGTGEPERIEQSPLHRKASQGIRAARILALVGALGIVLAGLLLGGMGLVLALLGLAGNKLPMVVASGSFMALCVGLGLALAWQAGQAIAGRPSNRFRPRRIGPWVLLFGVALILGQFILSSNLAAVFIFPPFHVAVAILPPLITLALVGRALEGAARWRDVILELGSGAFLSTSLAFVLEFVAILAAVAAGVAVLAILPGGLDTLQALANRLQDPSSLQNPDNLIGLVASPAVLFVVLAFTAGVIPIIEETVKTLGMGLLAYRRPSMPEAVLWGLASGAGFALAEALFNTISGLNGWAGVGLLRVGASLLHCFTGGLMGLAWYYFLTERRWQRIVGLYATAVALHGLWNAIPTGMTLISLLTGGPGASSATQGLAGVGSIGGLLLLILLAMGQIVGLVLLIRHVQGHDLSSQWPGSREVAPQVQDPAALE